MARMPTRRRPPRLHHLLTLQVVLWIVIAACAAPGGRAPSPSARGGGPSGAKVAVPPPRATPAAALDPNAERGCAPSAPHPYLDTIAAATSHAPQAETPNEVALTFDDGPAYTTTPKFLDYLEQTRTPATFFVIGRQAEALPDLIRREWRDGFPIGVHTWNHPNMTTLTVAQMRTQLDSTLDTLRAILGTSACLWLWRPPYGAVNATVRGVAASYGLTTITWNDDGHDWDRPGVETIANLILDRVHPGAIVLMHDGPARRDQTLAALPRILDGLKARGLTPVTLPRLLADCAYPGVHVGQGEAGTHGSGRKAAAARPGDNRRSVAAPVEEARE